MSYCVNCGVKLEESLNRCPLCNTPVINPNELLEETNRERKPSFPKEKGPVEVVKRKDFGILLTTILVATAATCGLLNLFVFRGAPWSVLVIGLCVITWVVCFPFIIFTGLPVYVSLLLDGASVALYLYLITFMTDSTHWFIGLGLPIVILVTVVAEIFMTCVLVLPRSFLTITLYLITTIGILCMGIEILIERFLEVPIALSWSAVTLTVCAIIDIALITMLSKARFRNAVRRRLHF